MKPEKVVLKLKQGQEMPQGGLKKRLTRGMGPKLCNDKALSQQEADLYMQLLLCDKSFNVSFYRNKMKANKVM